MELMSNCRFHPERAAYVVCQKHEVGYCQECLDACRACTDPCLYCKFRPGCVIWELSGRKLGSGPERRPGSKLSPALAFLL